MIDFLPPYRFEFLLQDGQARPQDVLTGINISIMPCATRNTYHSLIQTIFYLSDYWR